MMSFSKAFKKSLPVLLPVVLVLISYGTLQSNAQLPPDIYVGNPASAVGCAQSGCHGGGQVNVGTGTFTITSTAVNNVYKTDSTYTITYTLNETGKTRFGFESAILNSTFGTTGSMAIVNNTNSFVGNDPGNNNIQLIAHYNASSNHVWTVNWTAPHTYSGPIKIWAFGNAANGNGNADAGDDIYRSSLTLNPFNTLGITDVGYFEDNLSVYPNPSIDKLTIDLMNAVDEKSSIDLFDMNMKHVSSVVPEISGNRLHATVDVSLINAGIYFVRIQNGDQTTVKKIMVPEK